MSRLYHAPAGVAMLLTVVLTALMLPANAFAQGHHDGGHGGFGHSGGFGGGFHNHWHGGNWHQGWHNGRWGWWWIVPGLGWYSYDAPVYPYPDPYAPPGYAAAPGGQFWYYCTNPPGYYPYVAQCNVPWHPFLPPDAPG